MKKLMIEDCLNYLNSFSFLSASIADEELSINGVNLLGCLSVELIDESLISKNEEIGDFLKPYISLLPLKLFLTDDSSLVAFYKYC